MFDRCRASFLQQGLERRLSPSTLEVHVAAISAYHDHIDGKSIGKHDLVVRFLRGARRLNPPRPPSMPSWDLALVLRAIQIAPFEPLQSADLRILSMKTLLLGWATPNTFARFYSLRVEPVSSCVLTSGQRHGEVPAQYRLAALHTLIAPESPYRQTLLSPPITLRQPDVAEHPAPGLYSVVSLRTGFRLGPICVTLQGSHMCYSTGCS